MNLKAMVTFFLLAGSISSSSCTASERDALIVNPNLPDIMGIMLSMKKEQIIKNWKDIKWSYLNIEGLEYNVARIEIRKNIFVNVVFDDEEVVYEINTASTYIKYPPGIGVGTTLKKLQSSIPNGRFVYGDEEGGFANFLGDGVVIYIFNVNDINEECFDLQEVCDIDRNIQVKEVALRRK